VTLKMEAAGSSETLVSYIYMKTGELKFMRHTAGYSLLGHRRNEDIFEELKVDSVEKNYHTRNKNG
jgi:hypothetical protein